MRRSVFLLFLLASFAIRAQLHLTAGMSPQQLIQNFFQGSGISISNVSYTGYSNAVALFSDTSNAGCGLGFGSGIYLTSGSIIQTDTNNAFTNGQDGPNMPASGHQSLDQLACGGPGLGDSDLTAMVGVQTFDAAAIEFDFVPFYDTLVFNYVFGSEEYNDYVGSVNDAFAMYLDGVSVSFPKTNIALLPSSTVPVSINTINNGSAFALSTGPCMNCQYFRDNYNGNSMIDLAYDGFTTVLGVRYPVIPNQTYHIKIVIADAMDHVFDSGMFLEAGSFSSIGVATSIRDFSKNFDFIKVPRSVLLGYNDQFIVQGNNIREYLLNIYDNSGRLVCSSKNVNEQIPASVLANGMYYYVIYAVNMADEIAEKRGTINVVR